MTKTYAPLGPRRACFPDTPLTTSFEKLQLPPPPYSCFVLSRVLLGAPEVFRGVIEHGAVSTGAARACPTPPGGGSTSSAGAGDPARLLSDLVRSCCPVVRSQ